MTVMILCFMMNPKNGMKFYEDHQLCNSLEVDFGAAGANQPENRHHHQYDQSER